MNAPEENRKGNAGQGRLVIPSYADRDTGVQSGWVEEKGLHLGFWES